jgi:DNA mismatch repair protein MutS
MEPGPASRSYGVQVARLAGMPPSLVRQARATLEALENQANTTRAQVDLFAAPPLAATRTEDDFAALMQALRALDPDSLSPKAALEALYRLKQLSPENLP